MTVIIVSYNLVLGGWSIANELVDRRLVRVQLLDVLVQQSLPCALLHGRCSRWKLVQHLAEWKLLLLRSHRSLYVNAYLPSTTIRDHPILSSSLPEDI